MCISDMGGPLLVACVGVGMSIPITKWLLYPLDRSAIINGGASQGRVPSGCM